MEINVVLNYICLNLHRNSQYKFLSNQIIEKYKNLLITKDCIIKNIEKHTTHTHIYTHTIHTIFLNKKIKFKLMS